MSDPFSQPVSGFDLPRFAGVPTFMRLPHMPLDHPLLPEVEERLLDPKRMVHIGIRGTVYHRKDRDFAEANGIRIITIDEFHARGVPDVIAEARQIVGDAPTYLSYDIDFIDPAFAPGSGTPEVGGPNSYQALQVVRELGH